MSSIWMNSPRPSAAARRNPRLLLIFALAAALFAACAPQPILLPGQMEAPKLLATVVISPTPVGMLLVPPTATPVPSPTRTPLPPTPTASPTPYVGVFMGDGSAPLVLPTWPVAVVEITLQPPTPLGGVEAPLLPTPTIAGVQPVANPGVSVALLSAGACTDVGAAFAPDYNGGGLGGQLGCAVGPEQSVAMAFQPFERGMMIWLSTGDIFALAGGMVNNTPSTFWRVPDQWREGMAPGDASMTVPPGVRQPIRGFGLAWRIHDDIRSALGWAMADEEGYTGIFQRFERGLMLTAPDGSAYVFIAADPALERGQYIGPL